jgi:hypothetical protein
MTHSVISPPQIDAVRKAHSIISSARARIDCGTVRPSAPWVPVVEGTIIDVIDEPALADTERLASF